MPRIASAPSRPAAPAEVDPIDTITFDGDGTPISLIVSAPDAWEREKLKKLFLERNPNTRITADLPLVKAFAVRIGPDAIQILPELGKVAHDVRVVLDGEIGIPEPP